MGDNVKDLLSWNRSEWNSIFKVLSIPIFCGLYIHIAGICKYFLIQ